MKKVLLCVLDGVGIREIEKGNAFRCAKTPNFDYLWENYPHSLLEASGTFVGLPNRQMGNSEVGHTNIGAGRVVYQSLELINESIKNKSFFENDKILEVINQVKLNNSTLHLFGLLSDGGIHSHINHLFALLDMCKDNHLEKVVVHAFLDGRDTLPNVALKYLDKLNEKLSLFNYKLGTISGRYYAMDRDNNYDRIKKAYDVIVKSEGPSNSDYKDVIYSCYKEGIYDEFIPPTIINNEFIDNNDGLILFNFRPDRVRELFKAITNKEFNEFDTKNLNGIKLVTMLPVSEEVVCTTAFGYQRLDNTLGEYVSWLGLTQLRIAETEKYAHVTYFFDGGVEKDLPGMTKILIPSPSVATYDLKPEMSAYEITDKLITELDKNYDLVVLNFANGDMVGHTGDFGATVKAIEVLDSCLGRIYSKCDSADYTMIIIADHGNADYMLDDNNNIVTSHSVSPVPCIVTDKKYILKNGSLCDVAPTILKIMESSIPSEMSGNILIKEKII